MLATMDSSSFRIRERGGMWRVYAAICLLASEYGTPPPQSMVAKHMGVSQQYVSQEMRELEFAGMIRWLNRYVYAVDRSQWIPPEDARFI